MYDADLLDVVDEKNRVDISEGVPEGLIHIDDPRIGRLCKRLGIAYAKAIVKRKNFRKAGQPQFGAVCSGIVIKAIDEQSVRTVLAERDAKKEAALSRISVLSAVQTLNKRAKQCREMAQLYFQENLYQLARRCKKEKERIYKLKGQVLAHLLHEGRLKVSEIHQFEGGVFAEVLEGEGYRFHRPCPQPSELSRAAFLECPESNPKVEKDPSLEIAYLVVERFLKGKKKLPVYEWPSQYSPRTCCYVVDRDDDEYEAIADGIKALFDDYRERVMHDCNHRAMQNAPK